MPSVRKSGPLSSTSLPADRTSGAEAAFADLADWITTGLNHGASLLSAGERVIAQRILDLTGDEARLYARLAWRKPAAFALSALKAKGVSDIPAAAANLCALDLADALMGAAERPNPPKALGPSIRLRHRPLLLRLLRLAALETFPEPSAPLLSRLGVVRWPQYVPRGVVALFPSRAALLKWEVIADGIDSLTVADWWSALASGSGAAPVGLDQTHRLVRRLASATTVAQRTDPAGAAASWALLRPYLGASAVVSQARCLERMGDVANAARLLVDTRPKTTGADRLALNRAGRRTAHRGGLPWPPDPPLRQPNDRHVRLLSATPLQGRPRFGPAQDPRFVEEAIVAALAIQGREALHAEGGLWSTLSSLLLADLMFEPVADALPVPRLVAPLDRWTPAFRSRRSHGITQLLNDLHAGRGAQRLQQAVPTWHGVRIAGVDPRWSPVDLLRVVEAIDGKAVCAIVAALIDHPSASAGLPDLIILPGPDVVLDAVPGRIGPRALLAELKTETDHVSDAQAAWFDVLLSAGVPVERWTVLGHPSALI